MHFMFFLKMEFNCISRQSCIDYRIYDSDVKYHKCNTLDWHPFIGYVCRLVSAIRSRYADAPTKHKHRSYQIINKWLCINFRLIIFHKSKRMNELYLSCAMRPTMTSNHIGKYRKTDYHSRDCALTITTLGNVENGRGTKKKKRTLHHHWRNWFVSRLFEMFLSLFCHISCHKMCGE